MNAVGIDIFKDKSTITICKPGNVVLVPPHDIPHAQSARSDLIRQLGFYVDQKNYYKKQYPSVPVLP